MSNEELLSIIFKSGTRDNSVKTLAYNVLNRLDSIKELKDINYETLISIKGIKTAKACDLLASIELGKRINQKYTSINEIKIVDAYSVFEYYKDILSDKKQEYFYCLYLDTKNKIIKDKLLFMGTINQSLVHPREVFKEAYLVSASSIICVHNHPTGVTTPSQNDIVITEQLKKVGNILGIKLLDHIIIGYNEYYSFNENSKI